MKTIKQIGLIALAIIAISIIAGITACNNDTPEGEQPQKQPDTPRTLSFGTEENPCTVTITSDDQFTTAEWKTLCDKVVAAIESEYDRDNNEFNKYRFINVFKSERNIAVKVLPITASYQCEVKKNDDTMYLRVDAISTVDLQAAVTALDGGSENQQS